MWEKIRRLCFAVPVTFALIPLLHIAGCAPPPPFPKPLRPIRVCLSDEAKEVVISSEGSFRITSPGGTVLWSSRRHGGEVTLRRAGKGSAILICIPPSEMLEPSGKLMVWPSGRALLEFKGRSYRGHIEVFSGDGNPGLIVVNVTDLEGYLKGVLPLEIGEVPEGASEALKAQAIAARTYAYMRMLHPRGEHFDLYGDVRDQVYGGVSAEGRTFSRAVEGTEGIIVTYRGAPARTFFFSCCGGHTAAIDEVWDIASPPPYLCGVSDSLNGEALCGGSTGCGWRETWSADELSRILSEYLPRALGAVRKGDIGEVEDILIEERSSSGRVLSLKIATSRGDYILKKDRIRWALRRPVPGNPILRSTLFTVTLRKDASGKLEEVEIVGRGNGHGVGMCQRGAIGMAERGFNAFEILRHYYPGTSIGRVGPISGPIL